MRKFLELSKDENIIIWNDYNIVEILIIVIVKVMKFFNIKLLYKIKEFRVFKRIRYIEE